MSLQVGTIHDIELSHVLSPDEYYVKILTPHYHNLQSQLSSHSSQPQQCWTSFLPAFPSRLVLAKSSQKNSWLRARIVSTALSHVTVQYLDWGPSEEVSDPTLLANLPPGLDFCPLAILVRLDSFLPHAEYERKIKKLLVRKSANEGAEWKMLIKSVTGKTCSVEILLASRPACPTRLSDLLSSLQLGSLAGRDSHQQADSLPSWSGLSGHRLAVAVCQEPLPSPSSLLLTVEEVTQHLQSGLALCEESVLTRLSEGSLLAVKVSGCWYRGRLVQAGLVATVLLVDSHTSDSQVRVEYRDCRDLPASLHGLPAASVSVQLAGLQFDGWTEASSARLADLLHLPTMQYHTPRLGIIVHCMDTKVWTVTLIEEVSRNHQVNIAALLVAEGLAKCLYKKQMRVVLGWGEARDGDAGPWLKGGVEFEVEDWGNSGFRDRVGTTEHSCDSTRTADSPDSFLTDEFCSDMHGTVQTDKYAASTSLDSCQTQEDRLNDTPDNVQTDEYSKRNTPDSPDSGLGGKDSASHCLWSDSRAVDSLPDNFTGLITNIEMEAGLVWLVPRSMKAQQKLVITLLASMSRRLPEPGTGSECKEEDWRWCTCLVGGRQELVQGQGAGDTPGHVHHSDLHRLG
eukprot:GFUD01009725.1.p1 GENE.GFUD01009725.1~~GFUD01009725.1.p1  ORF type:complete len:626 (+),score=222.15 GFUD01009725.1:46-1923(+)